MRLKVALPTVNVVVQRRVTHVKADGMVLNMLLNVNIECPLGYASQRGEQGLSLYGRRGHTPPWGVIKTPYWTITSV
jgi:hypothetical protein